MPVKKNKAKKHSHHEKNGRHSEQMNKDRDAIKKMVGDIPALIKKEGYFDKKAEVQPTYDQRKEEITENLDNDKKYFDETTNEQKESTPMVITHPKKRLWLWSGVITVTMVIFGIWILNMKNIFYDVRNSKGFEESLIGSSKEDFDDIWKTLQLNDKNIQEQVDKNNVDITTSTPKKDLEEIMNEIITPLKNTITTNSWSNTMTK